MLFLQGDMMKVAVLISGRGSNLKSILEAEKKNLLGEAEVAAIISDNPLAHGLKYAKEYKKQSVIIDFSKFKSKNDFEQKLISVLENAQIELIVLAGFMRILSPAFIDLFRNKIINIHPSLLPSFPGLNAQKQAFDFGVKISGCTVHFVTEEIDAGPIILQKAIEIENDDTEESISSKILSWEHILLPQAIKLFSEKKMILRNNKVKVV